MCLGSACQSILFIDPTVSLFNPAVTPAAVRTNVDEIGAEIRTLHHMAITGHFGTDRAFHVGDNVDSL